MNNKNQKSLFLKIIPHNVIAMGIVSFFNEIASEMIYPVLPLFLTSVLGTSIITVGLIEGIAEASANFFKVLSGWLSDRTGQRKPFVVLGYSLSTLSKLLFGWAHSWHMALIARTSDRFGKGLRTAARDALIAESTDTSIRGRAFGFHLGLDTLGAVAGPLITLALLTYTTISFQTIFLLACIPGVISLLTLILLVNEVRIPSQKNRTMDLSLFNFGIPFFIFLVINALFALGNSSNAFIILRSEALGLSLSSIITLYTLFTASNAIASVPAGIISDHIGPQRVMILGFSLFSGVYYFLGTAQSTHILWILLPLYGFYMALTDGIGKAYISHLVPREKLGTAYGIFQVTVGVGNLIASLLAGILWSHYGSSSPFILGSITAFIAALLLLFTHLKRGEVTAF